MEKLFYFVSRFCWCFNKKCSFYWFHKLICLLWGNLSFKVTFSSNQKYKGLITSLLIKLIQPLLKSFKALHIVNRINQKYSSCSSIKVICYGFIHILTALYQIKYTVSQICNWTGSSSTITVFEEKSTPTVTWYSSLNFPWIYLWIREVFPVPV